MSRPLSARAMEVRLGVLAAALLATAAPAEELPVNLQVQLLSKMSTYIANFGSDAAGVKVLVVYPGPTESPSRGAQALASAITQVGQFGTAKVEPKLFAFVDVKKLQATLAQEKPQVIYLAPELDEKSVAGVVEAAQSGKAVTISGVGGHVKLGVVLGFSLVEARPRVLINLKQANKQSIVFANGLLSHSVIVDR